MRTNHRTRLAMVSAATSGAVLLILFASVLMIARATSFANRRAELAAALNNFTLDPKEGFDLHEFREAHPEFTVAVFDKHARLIGSEGPLRLLPKAGLAETEGALYFGKEFQGRTLVVGTNLGEISRSLGLLSLVLAGLWPLLTLLVGLSTWRTARAVFRPLERLSAQASSAAGSDLSERLATDDGFEFGDFARELNGMLDRIEIEVRRTDRFAADAAHELRTPLAILRARIEMALLNSRSAEEYAEVLRRTLSEVQRLTDVTQALLSTARGELPPAAPRDVGLAVKDAVHRWHDDFNARGVRITAETNSALASAREDELRMIFDNLLDNALRFAPPGSEVRVKVVQGDSTVDVEVADRGPGIADALGDRIFDRLVRGDDSRNRGSGGAGIGLSVVRRIAEARGGLAFHQETPGGGATIVVRFPLVRYGVSDGEAEPELTI